MSREFAEKFYDLITENGNPSVLQYAARFVLANAEYNKADFLAKFDQDDADRVEAYRREQHRKQQVLDAFVDTFGNSQDAIATLLGGQAAASGGEFNQVGN